MSEYIPQIDDYVIWDRGVYGKDEGWVYFKGDSVDNELRRKQGWNPISQYITIETGVKEKKNCVTCFNEMNNESSKSVLSC